MNLRILSIPSLLLITSIVNCYIHTTDLKKLEEERESLSKKAAANEEHQNLIKLNNIYLDLQQWRHFFEKKCASSTQPWYGQSAECLALNEYNATMNFLKKEIKDLTQKRNNMPEIIELCQLDEEIAKHYPH